MKCKLLKNVTDITTKRAVDGIIDILLRAYAQQCKSILEEDGLPHNFKGFTEAILSMNAEEFAKIPIMKKSEYYGE